MNFFAHLQWDPSRFCFIIPYINHPITWYGVCFATGFIIGYFLIRHVFGAYLGLDKESLIRFTDRFMLIIIIGSLVGARLGYVFFYGWPYYQAHPGEIVKIWEGGLASHGGAMGALLALFIFSRMQKKLSFMALLDAVVVPTAFAGACIRIGNFINQEITGTPTNLPWGVNFLHPLDGPGGVVHPVQLYESIFYFALFGVMVLLWRSRKKMLGEGLLTGVFFVTLFAFRFIVEFVKIPQGDVISSTSLLRMGQLLSLPFIALGVGLLIRYTRRKRDVASS